MTESTDVLVALSTSTNKAHLLLHWHTELHARIAKEHADVAATLREIEQQVDFLHDDRNRESLDSLSQPIWAAIAKNYAALLTKSRSGLFDIANRHVSTFTDSKKPQQLRSLSCVVLTHLYMSFGREIVSFIPVLLTTLIKTFRKDKNTLQLAELWYALLRNGGREELNDSLVSKTVKLLKQIDNTEALAMLYSSLGVVMSYKASDLITFKTAYQSTIHSGLKSHKKIRVATAKSTAEACIGLNWDPKVSLTLYKDLYLDSNHHEEQVGLVESIIHFIHLNIMRDDEFVTTNLELVVSTLLDVYNHERFHAFALNRKYRTVNHILYVFRTVFTLIGESSQASILEHSLMPLIDKEVDPWKLITLLKLAAIVIANASSLSDTRVEKYRITLWKLCLAANYEIQANAVLVLKEVASKSPATLKELLETCLNEVVNNAKQQASDKISIKSHGLALIIANLVSLADKDYVPQMLIENIWKSSIDHIKENIIISEQNKNTVIISWISLYGVFSYKDKSFIESLTDEFMILWEALDLTKHLSTAPLPTLTVIGHALTALLCFLHNITIDKHVAKFFVESLDALRTITSTLKVTSGAEPLLETIKRRCYEIYLCCIDFVKTENSSVMIRTIAQFADLPNYETLVKNELITPWTKDDGFSNGLSSKFCGYKTDELMIKFNTVEYAETQKEYSIDTQRIPIGSISSGTVKSWICDATWIDELETTLLSPVSCALEHDLIQPIIDQYSFYNVYSPPSKIASIDTAMEIFITAFPSLSTKVQLSLLETLRTHLLSKSSNSSTKTAQAINASIVLHGVMLVSLRENSQFDAQVGTILLETLRFLYTTNPSPHLLVMNAEAIGLLISRCPLKEQIPIFIKKIFDEESSGARAFNALILSYIYHYNSSHFSEIMPVLLELSQDPHPTVHSWAMDSLATIIDKHVAMNSATAVQVLHIVEMCYLDDRYGRFSSSNYSNLNADADSHAVLARTLRSVVTSLGPGVSDLDKTSRETIRSLIPALFWYDNNANSRLDIVKLIQELMVYDEQAIENMSIVTILKYLIHCNIGLFIGSEITINIYEERNELFPITSSTKMLDLSLDLLSQLVKTREDKSFISEVEPLVWLSLERVPESEILSNLVSQWLDATYDLGWFVKLQMLFNASKQQLFYVIMKESKHILEKYSHKKTTVDVKDEEAQSITNKADGEVKGESVNWKFKTRILVFVKQLLSYTERDTKLYRELSARVSDLIKISFAASTSSSEQLRFLGIKILGDIITIYAPAKDPIYSTMSLLEQQQAQITSALVPAFQEDSSPLLVAEAIKVVAMFIGSGVVSVSKLGRTAKILTGALEDLTTEEDEFRVSNVLITSEIGQRRVKLAILNAWAELKSLNDGHNKDLDDLVNEHLELLLPLWISTLKEFALLRHGTFKDDELYRECWVNLVDVIGCITQEDVSSIEALLQNDALGFYYMLYAHCMFALLKSPDKAKVLRVFVKILGFKDLIKLVYFDEIFHETLEILERLIVTGQVEEKFILLDITTRMFVNYFEVSSEEEFGQNADKLFEILRLNLQSVTEFIPEEGQEPKEMSSSEINLVKKSLNSITKMISYFPDMIKHDLYACVLSIITRAYASSSSERLVTLVLPTVKEITHDLVAMDDVDILNNFFQTIRPSLNKPFITIATISVLLSTAPTTLKLTESDIDLIVSSILTALDEPEQAQLATQSIKSITVAGTPTSDALLRKIIPRFISAALTHDDSRLFVELLVLIIKHHACVPLYTLIIPTFLQVYDQHPQMGEYLNKRMVHLITISPECFKTVLGGLDADQRRATEMLVKFGGATVGEVEDEEDHIKLKDF